jgi:hypothetical protein
MEETQFQEQDSEIIDNNTQPEDKAVSEIASLFGAAKNGQSPAVASPPASEPAKEAVEPAAETEKVQETSTEAVPATEEKPAVEIDYAQVLKEKTGGEVDSLEKLTALLEENKKLKAEPQKPALSEDEQRLLDMYRKGEDFIAYQQFQSVDFDGMDAVEVMREKYLRDNADLPKEVANRLFERELSAKFPNLNDEYSEEDRLADEALLKRAADKDRQALKQLQSEQRIKPYEQPNNDADVLSEEEVQKQVEAHLATVKETLDKFEKLTFDIEGQDVTIPVSQEDKETLAKEMEYPFGALQEDYIKDGKFDAMQFAMDRFVRKNLKAIQKVSFEAGLVQGKKQLIEQDLKHRTELDTPASSTQGVDAVTELAKMFGQKVNQSQRF